MKTIIVHMLKCVFERSKPIIDNFSLWRINPFKTWKQIRIAVCYTPRVNMSDEMKAITCNFASWQNYTTLCWFIKQVWCLICHVFGQMTSVIVYDMFWFCLAYFNKVKDKWSSLWNLLLFENFLYNFLYLKLTVYVE